MFVKHLTVTGRFPDVTGTITLEEQDPLSTRAEVSIKAAGIDTGNARRDTHLRGSDFFDVDRHPTLTFVSSRVEPVDSHTGHYRLVGDLTVQGVTREVTLETHDAPVPGAPFHERMSLTLTGSLRRHDFGIVWSNPAMKVAEDLNVALKIQLTRV